MAGIGVAVVGAGFIGPVHVEALRRAGQRVIGILGVSPEESSGAAERLGLDKAYQDFACRPCTSPRRTGCTIRWPRRPCEAGKHVLCEKPLAMNSAESPSWSNWPRVGLAAGVNYNIRYYPLCLEAADIVHGRPWAVYSRLRQLRAGLAVPRHGLQLAGAGRRGRRVAGDADIGTHWLDLIHAVTGLEVESVCADLYTVHPGSQAAHGEVETFKRQGGAAGGDRADRDHHRGLRLHPAAVRRRSARLPVGVSQVTAGRKNCLRYEMAGSLRRWPGAASAQRAVDRSPRPAQREPDPRSVAGGRPRAGTSSTIPAATTRASRTRSSSASARSTSTSRPGFPGPADVPDVRRRTPRDRAVRGHPEQPPPTRLGRRAPVDSAKRRSVVQISCLRRNNVILPNAASGRNQIV
jgi:hypothetical protein